MREILARKENYFDIPGLPVTLRRVSVTGQHSPSHPHDFTEVPHRHDFHELVLVVRGRGVHLLQDVEYPIQAGDVFLLQAEQKHCFSECEGLELINLMYEPAELQLPENRLRRLPGYCALFMLEPSYRRRHRFASRLHLGRIALGHALRLTDGMEKELKDRRPGYEILLVNQLLELIVFLSREYSNSTATEARALLRVGDVIGALETDFRRDWKLEDLQEIAHMSRSNFLRIFRKATGRSPIDYLIRLRVQQAMTILRNGSENVSETAFAVGFSDVNYFSRQFRRITGMSPTAFREA